MLISVMALAALSGKILLHSFIYLFFFSGWFMLDRNTRKNLCDLVCNELSRCFGKVALFSRTTQPFFKKGSCGNTDCSRVPEVFLLFFFFLQTTLPNLRINRKTGVRHPPCTKGCALVSRKKCYGNRNSPIWKF